MRFGEYTDLTSLPGRLPAQGSLGRAAAESLFTAEFVRDTVLAARELNALTWAVRDAAAEVGSFPIVVYGPSRDGVSFENSTLAEYLASNGYIVLASPSSGAAGPMTADFEGIETQARDMEVLMAYGRTLASADTTRIALVGDSWGGMSNILVAMRNASVNAVVTLDGSIAYWYNRRFKGEPFVNPDRLTAPVLFLKQGDPFPSMSPSERAAYGPDTVFSFFHEVRHADAYLVTLETVRHQNFKALSNRFPPSDLSTGSFVADPRVSSVAYERECRYTLAFLDAYLKGSRSAGALLTESPAEAGIPPREVTIVRRPVREAKP
jgi:dienelactone hydrolase